MNCIDIVKSTPVEDIIENAFCISISEERKQLTTLIFQRVFGVVPHFFDGYTTESPSHNCTMSHGAIVRMAKALDLPFVTIFEDDTLPRPDAKEVISSCLKSVPDDAMCIVLGSALDRNLECVNEHIRKVFYRGIFGSHAYIMLKSGYDNYLEQYPRLADCYWSIIGPTYAIINSFTQFNYKRSGINSHIGYPFHGITPPPGFYSPNDLLVTNLFKHR